MRRKSVRRVGFVNPPPKTTNATGAVRRCPSLAGRSEGVNYAAVPETYSDSDDDLEDVRMAGLNDNMTDCMKEHSNESPFNISSHDDLCIDILDRKICLGCNEGGQVLVCSEIGCPVSLHSKCMGSEPSFDNMGNFYCPYCQYKRAVTKVKELKNKARIEKKSLLKFLGKNVVTGDKATQKNGTVRTTKHQEVPHTGVEDIFDGCNRKGSSSVQGRPLQTGDQEREMGRNAACADQRETAIEGEADAKASVNNTTKFQRYAKEETMNREIFDDIISQKDEIRFVKVKERIETEDPRHNDEGLHETSVENGEEEEPLNASPLRVLAPDIAFAEGTEENLVAGTESKGRMKNIEQVLQRVPANDRSFNEIINSYSYSGDLSLRKRGFKKRANRTAYLQTVDSDSTRETPGKRKRLRWTTEEENMLKEGVSRFAMENHNIPWRKILKYGCNVFDSTRTPVDLKDKWRNVTAKEGKN